MLKPQQIRGARAMLGMTQADLAARVSLSATALNSIERGTSDPRASNLAAIQSALETAGVEFIPEDRRGVGVRLRNTAAFEERLTSLIYTHSSDAELSRVEVIVAGVSEEERDALSLAFGDRVWGRNNLPTDARGREIQDRLVRVGRFAS